MPTVVKKRSTIIDRIRKAAPVKKPVPKAILWKGPQVDGITYSMLSRWLVCRERFRLMAVEGLKEEDYFNHRLEYGNMWHACEEALAKKASWEAALKAYCINLAQQYREQSGEVSKWYNVCKTQFPAYVEHWRKHPDVKGRKPVYQEKVFDVPYKLPSGRIIRLRGKWDATDIIDKSLYLQENKSKGDVNAERLQSELRFDLQTMMYLTALTIHQTGSNTEKVVRQTPLGGVRYNVVRRPLSGQKYNISQRKGQGKAKKGAETEEQYYKRLGQVIRDDPDYFFIRFRVEVSVGDLQRFHQMTLNPILEQLCDWWEWIAVDPFDPYRRSSIEAANGIGNCHFLMPYGVYSPLLEGRGTILDEYLATGNDRGLQRVDRLFTELA